jgi:adenylate cyclase
MKNEDLVPANLNVTRTLTTVLFTRATNLASAAPEQQAYVLNLLQRDFEVMRAMCRQYRGQVLKSIGESLLMTFSSGSNAVICALKIQSELRTLTLSSRGQFTLLHSIGLHLGEVLLTESDVLGNEVNLAMQLQAEVSDGEICISQPLYEVVKLSTNLQVQSLGERLLKGASAPLELYRVFPQSLTLLGNSTSSQAEPSERKGAEPLRLQISQPVLPKRSQIAQKLEQHTALNRMKRLLLFACRNHWESNPDVLQNLSCLELLTELQERVLTFDALQAVLDLAVSRLNKKAEYTDSVNVLLHQLKPLYDEMSPELTTRYQQIAHNLEAHPASERIKKLLLWAIREHWERDPLVLQETRTATLLSELAIRAPSPGQLDMILYRATQCLNKPTEYQAIAALIRQALAPAYEQIQELETVGSTAIAPPSIALTQDRSQPTAPPKPPAPNPTEVRGNVAKHAPVVPSPEPIKPIPPSRPPRTPLPPLLSAEQSFNLRFSLMQRVNPLRLKALLYSVLHQPINLSDRSWSVLQKESLDDLLVQLIRQHDTLEALSQALYRVAVLPSSGEDGLQIMESVLRVLEAELMLHTQPVSR